jgi:hypothetical protein
MPAIAFFAHPGHELRALGWCMRHRPMVAFLTNGQGSKDGGRLATSVGILNEIGCRLSRRSGRLADREAYEAILEERPEVIEETFHSILEEIDEQPDAIIFDRTEGFNPTHDLVGVLGRELARRLSSGRGGAKPAQWAISLEALPSDDERHPDAEELCRCSDEELARKVRLAESYRELAPEVAEAIRTSGAEAFRTEWGHRIDPRLGVEQLIPLEPAFERYGEERVRRGIYTKVLRRDEHLLPFVRSLLKRLDANR